MAELNQIVAFLDDTLQTSAVSDPYSSNGLQVEGQAQVQRLGFCVDACLQTFELLSDCQLIVVHHGLFWPSLTRIQGPVYRSLHQLISLGIGLYCSHLPLDRHRELGNNAQLLKLLGLAPLNEFAPVGWTGEFSEARPREELAQTLEQWLNPVRLLAFGEPMVGRIAVSSGQASVSMVTEAQRLGCQLLLTGEASHPIYHAAKEAGLNVILGGHYATETWGVKALMNVLETQFSVTTRFVDVPTGF